MGGEREWRKWCQQMNKRGHRLWKSRALKWRHTLERAGKEGGKRIRLKIKVSSVCTHGILSIFSSPPSVQSSPPFFPLVRTLHNIFPAPLSSYTSSVPAPHPHPCLLRSHTQTHRLVSCEIFLFQISFAGHWTDSQMRQEPSHGPTPPTPFISRTPPSSWQWSCLTSLTVDALSCPPIHTQSHILMHTHTYSYTFLYRLTPSSSPDLSLWHSHDAAVSESCAVAWRRGRRVGCKGLPPRSAVSCLGREWVGFQALCCVCVCVCIRVGVCSIDKRYLWHPKAKKRHSKKGPQHKGTESLIVLL